MKGGLRCPVCNTDKLLVAETRLTANNISRTRLCFNEHRFRTEEVIVKVLPDKSAQRKQVLKLLDAGGLTNKEIARQCGVHPYTVSRIKLQEWPGSRHKRDLPTIFPSTDKGTSK